MTKTLLAHILMQEPCLTGTETGCRHNILPLSGLCQEAEGEQRLRRLRTCIMQRIAALRNRNLRHSLIADPRPRTMSLTCDSGVERAVAKRNPTLPCDDHSGSAFHLQLVPSEQAVCRNSASREKSDGYRCLSALGLGFVEFSCMTM